MRKVYLLLNTIFIIIIVMLLNAYAKSLEASENLAKKRSQNITEVKKIRKNRHVRAKVAIPEEDLVAILKESNLFEVNRGEELVETAKKPDAPRNNTSFKLMGVCHYGEIKGAIITSNSQSKNSSGKSYFTIGEDVGDGYKLYDIAEKSVVLKSGNRKVTLELSKAESRPQTNSPRRRVTPRRPSPRRSSRPHRR